MKIAKLKIENSTRGFSLFIAVIVMSALLLAAFAVVNIASKETSFTTSNRASHYALFAADAGIECALYWDSKQSPSRFDASADGSPITCNGQSISTGSSISGTTTTAVVGGGTGGGPPPSGNSASFVGTDSSTAGSWIGVYGAEGSEIPNYSNSFLSPPASVSVLTDGLTYEWTNSTSDPRALQIPPSGSSRIASTWYTNTANVSFYIDINIADGASHKVALYLLDWDASGRTERIDVLNGDNSSVLSTQNASNFGNGVYYKWVISGHVKFVITNTNQASNPIVNAIFFNPNNGGASSGSIFGFSLNSVSNPSTECAIVSVTKDVGGSTHIFSRGYNTCNASDPRRVERGIEVQY